MLDKASTLIVTVAKSLSKSTLLLFFLGEVARFGSMVNPASLIREALWRRFSSLWLLNSLQSARTVTT